MTSPKLSQRREGSELQRFDLASIFEEESEIVQESLTGKIIELKARRPSSNAKRLAGPNAGIRSGIVHTKEAA